MSRSFQWLWNQNQHPSTSTKCNARWWAVPLLAKCMRACDNSFSALKTGRVVLQSETENTSQILTWLPWERQAWDAVLILVGSNHIFLPRHPLHFLPTTIRVYVSAGTRVNKFSIIWTLLSIGIELRCFDSAVCCNEKPDPTNPELLKYWGMRKFKWALLSLKGKQIRWLVFEYWVHWFLPMCIQI